MSVTIIFGVLLVTYKFGLRKGKRSVKNQLEVAQNLTNKYNAMYNFTAKWLFLKQINEPICEYFYENNYNNIAIYGMHILGERLLKELENSNVEVSYAMDRNAENIVCNIPIKHPDDDLPKVDAIIVTTFLNYEEVKLMLRERVDCPIISLEEVILGI